MLTITCQVTIDRGSAGREDSSTSARRICGTNSQNGRRGSVAAYGAQLRVAAEGERRQQGRGLTTQNTCPKHEVVSTTPNWEARAEYLQAHSRYQ
jgi:hypothetical protein